MEILQIKNLTFHYPECESAAVNNVSLSVKRGELVLLCGQSGCGKSTLLKLIKKELSPYGRQSGQVLYDGKDIAEIDPRVGAADIGFVLQDPESQIVTDTVSHELAFGLESLGVDTNTIRRRVVEMASYFGIGEWFGKKAAELSGGAKQLLNLASVMVMQPKLLLLDEPTAQLDPIASANFISTLQKLNRELGLTVIIAEHRLEELFPIADRVVVMDGGSVIYNGAPQKIDIDISHPMSRALPASMRIFRELDSGISPLSVKEGREYVINSYSNSVSSLDIPPYSHSGDIAVRLKDVFFTYDRKSADILRALSLTVYKGEHFCILGSNGCGKTTTLNVIAGALKPYRGRVTVNNKHIALLPQDPNTVFLEKTVADDLKETAKGIDFVVDMLGISHILHMHPYDLSGGERQKAALAKVLLLQPQILLLDEPTKGIDPESKTDLASIISRLTSNGVTVITVTHDVEFAASTADRCAMFFDGCAVSVDTPERFFGENSFYTTAANRISRGHFHNAVLCEQVTELCRLNGKKAVSL